MPSLEQIADALGRPNIAPHLTGIPQATLSAVPHLARLQSKVSADPYISETWRLRQEYAQELALDPLITLGQSLHVKDPISRAMWKLIILDHFVDFDKLYATLGQGYDQHDEAKDIAPGFSLVKKDVASAKRATTALPFPQSSPLCVIFSPNWDQETLIISI
ncbi:hypothetical protein C0992_009812 [Termitomyces sp. T32_za158]|nr:hypothetical protein C0992_009812 [Termitomyces sp. T32_za158]